MSSLVLSRWGPVVAYAALIFWLSHQPTLPAPPGGDKTAHVVAYAGLGFLLARASGPRVGARSRLLLAWIGASLYGVSDEWHQSFVPGRHASLGDIGADTIGAAIGGVVFIAARRVAMQLSSRRCAEKRGVSNSTLEAAERPPKEAS